MNKNKALVEINLLLSEEDAKKYAGQYVCTVSFQDHTVVSAHEDPSVARQEAIKKGYFDPVCFYVSGPDETLSPSCGKWSFLETSEAITIR